MTNGVFVFNSDWKDEVFRNNLKENFPNSKELYIIDNDSNKGIFSKNEFMNSLLLNKFEFFNKIIDDFINLNSEFIIVIGCEDELIDQKIAKNLCIPILLSQNSSYKKEFLKTSTFTNIDNLKNHKSNEISSVLFQKSLISKARKLARTVVLPESEDERILKAANEILRLKASEIILLGDEKEILNKAKELNLDLRKAKIINPINSDLLAKFAQEIYEKRKHKGLNLEDAKTLALDKNYFGTMLVNDDFAHAMVSGAIGTTGDTIRPALQLIKTKANIKTVSGSFIMCVNNQIWIFADCAIVPKPSKEELASIAISSAKTAQDFGLEARVALLSYASGNSAKGEEIDFIKETLEEIKIKEPDLLVDGPIQFDAAIIPKIAKKKMPDSKIAGKANVFIFPDLNTGNICYKAVQRSANALAIGPILQGLNKPVNDLSRGCEIQDIVNTILVSALQG